MSYESSQPTSLPHRRSLRWVRVLAVMLCCVGCTTTPAVAAPKASTVKPAPLTLLSTTTDDLEVSGRAEEPSAIASTGTTSPPGPTLEQTELSPEPSLAVLGGPALITDHVGYSYVLTFTALPTFSVSVDIQNAPPGKALIEVVVELPKSVGSLVNSTPGRNAFPTALPFLRPLWPMDSAACGGAIGGLVTFELSEPAGIYCMSVSTVYQVSAKTTALDPDQSTDIDISYEGLFELGGLVDEADAAAAAASYEAGPTLWVLTNISEFIIDKSTFSSEQEIQCLPVDTQTSSDPYRFLWQSQTVVGTSCQKG